MAIKKLTVLSFIALILCGAITVLSAYALFDSTMKAKDSNDNEVFPVELSVMSFNIRTISLDTNQDDLWTNRKPRVISTILDHSPDIAGLQEVTLMQFKVLKEALTGYESISYPRDDFFNSECSSIFYKTEKLELISQGNFWLSETPDVMSKGWDAAINRICTYAVFRDKKSGREFAHFNTHLDHKGVVAREEGSKLIIARIAALGYPAVLTGDFNFNEASSNYTYIRENLDDTKYLAKDTMYAATFHGYRSEDTSGGSPIDFCFVTKGFLAERYSVLMGKVDGKYASDHYPVLSRIKLP